MVDVSSLKQRVTDKKKVAPIFQFNFVKLASKIALVC